MRIFLCYAELIKLSLLKYTVIMEAGISISTEAFLLHCHVFSLHANCAASQMNIYPLTTLLGIPPFAFRTTLILHAIYSKRCWKHSSEIFIHIDTIASQIHYMNLAVPPP